MASCKVDCKPTCSTPKSSNVAICSIPKALYKATSQYPPEENNPLGGLCVDQDETSALIDAPNFKAAMLFKENVLSAKNFRDIEEVFCKKGKSDEIKMCVNYINSPILDFLYDSIVTNLVRNMHYLFRLACMQTSDIWTVKYLIDRGADLRAYNNTYAAAAAVQGNLDLLKYLVERGVDMHASNYLALTRAKANGHLHVVKYLVGLDAPVDGNGDGNKTTSLATAVPLYHTERVISAIIDMRKLFNK